MVIRKKHKKEGKAAVIVGLQWGDEGKGKITDFYADKEGCDITIRFQGGNNAGHTIQPDPNEPPIALHNIPSGILISEYVVLADGMVICPYTLVEEVEHLNSRIDYDAWDKILIGSNTPMTLYWHMVEDALETASQGSTMRGIASTCADEDYRIGPTFGFLKSEKALKKQLGKFFEKKKETFSRKYTEERKEKAEKLLIDRYGKEEGSRIWKLGTEFDADKETDRLIELYDNYLKDKIIVTHKFLNEAYKNGKSLGFEGAQGKELDKKLGVKGGNTSTHTTVHGVGVGTCFDAVKIKTKIGVIKSYASRVGGKSGEVPTWIGETDLNKLEKREIERLGKNELKELYAQANSGDEYAVQKIIINKGKEYGTTTGRVRGVAWLDLVKVAEAIEVNNLNEIAFTKGDILGGLEKVKFCKSYEFHDEITESQPSNLLDDLEDCKPIYEEMDGWGQYTDDEWAEMADKGFEALPENMQKFYKAVIGGLYRKNDMKMNRVYVSASPRRGAVAVLEKDFLENEIYSKIDAVA